MERDGVEALIQAAIREAQKKSAISQRRNGSEVPNEETVLNRITAGLLQQVLDDHRKRRRTVPIALPTQTQPRIQ